MDGGRVSTQEAWDNIMSFYQEISEEVDANPLIEETLYADNKPFATVRNPRRPLLTWDYEKGEPVRIREATSVWEVAELAANGEITLLEGLLWCDTYGASSKELEELYTEFKCDRLLLQNYHHQHKHKRWYYRLVEFINRTIEKVWNIIMEDLL